MSTESINQSFQAIRIELGRHINLRTQLAGLLINKKVAAVATQLFTIILLGGFISMIFLLLSFAFVFWYGSSVGPYHHGFLIISLVYFIVGVIVFVNRKRLFYQPIIRKLSENDINFLNYSTDEQQPLTSVEDFNRRVEITRLKIEYSELLLQQEIMKLGDNLHPATIINRWLEQSKPFHMLGSKALDLLIAFLSRKK
jgi:hypothetical protein